MVILFNLVRWWVCFIIVLRFFRFVGCYCVSVILICFGVLGVVFLGVRWIGGCLVWCVVEIFRMFYWNGKRLDFLVWIFVYGGYGCVWWRSVCRILVLVLVWWVIFLGGCFCGWVCGWYWWWCWWCNWWRLLVLGSCIRVGFRYWLFRWYRWRCCRVLVLRYRLYSGSSGCFLVCWFCFLVGWWFFCWGLCWIGELFWIWIEIWIIILVVSWWVGL